MNAEQIQVIFLEMLRSELTETPLPAQTKKRLTLDISPVLFTLAKKHDLAHMISASLFRNGITADKALTAGFQKEEILCVYRYEQMQRAFTQLCTLFDSLKIPYIPLKGSVLRPYYPNPSMRTSCDIDILIPEADIPAAIDALSAQGWRSEGRAYHDVSLYSPLNIHLELHFSILENSDNLDTVLKNAWDYAIPVGGSRYEFTKEFFQFHIFAHMSYHFLGGGCGARALMDIWIMHHRMDIDLDDSRVLLEQAGIWKFAGELSSLAEICFSGAPKSNNDDMLLSYILGGGVYGSTEQHVAMKKTKTDGFFHYALQRIFMPYRDMAIMYPILKKLPILLPFCWIIRFFAILLTGRTKKAISELKLAGTMQDSRVEQMQTLRSILDL